MKNIFLTVFYSGRDDYSEGIEFKAGILSKSSIREIIKDNSNGQTRFMFITDCLGGGSVFDITAAKMRFHFKLQKVAQSSQKK
ncbi:hypothetical protein M9Y10_015574 [Tritrichomonas musculus]|uniref:Uncharacterized protein n=1 Tax=Tritrichomonas musculus TaxID=1915356 RepID=A0ABR2L2R3_9EUKA